MQKQFAALIGDREPIMLHGTFSLLGAAPRYMVRIADDNSVYLEVLCNKLIAAGGACAVLRMKRVKVRGLQTHNPVPPLTASKGAAHSHPNKLSFIRTFGNFEQRSSGICRDRAAGYRSALGNGLLLPISIDECQDRDAIRVGMRDVPARAAARLPRLTGYGAVTEEIEQLDA